MSSLKQIIIVKKSQWRVLVSSFLQLVNPGIMTLLGYTLESEGDAPQITPAAFTFIVWGVITTLSFAYGVYQALPHHGNNGLHMILSKTLTTIYLLFVVWLIAAAMQLLFITVLIFVVMFIVLILVFDKLIKERNNLNRAEQIILFGQIAIYTGWTTIAIFANTASAIKYYGLSGVGVTGMIWQAAILILALINGKYWLEKFNRNLTFGITLLWALTGVFFGLIQYKKWALTNN